MLKTPITSKAATLVERHEREVSALRQQCQKATHNLSRNRSLLLSQPSLLIWSFAAGTYAGARRKKVKVVTHETVKSSTSVPLFSLLNTGLSLLALRRKATKVFAEDTSEKPSTADARSPEL